MRKLKVTAVSYLNTKPLLYGIFQSGLDDKIDLQLDIPSVSAQKLLNEEVDLGLVPVAVIPALSSSYIISDFCIGADGPVRTVALFSHRPIEKVEKVYLDYHSKTSVELTRILLKKYWKVNPELVPAVKGYETKIKKHEAALIIGDRAVEFEQLFPYAHDLGQAWKDYSKLPFVFAAWISRRSLDPSFVNDLNNALQLGIDHIPQLIYLLPTPQPGFDLHTYFHRNISYQLDAAKKKALNLFLREMTADWAAPLEPQIMFG